VISRPEPEGGVWLLAGNTVLGAALQAGLIAAGWDTERIPGLDELAHVVRERGTIGRLVLAGDSQGNLPDPSAALAGLPRPIVVAIGSRRPFSALADLVERRIASAVLDGDQPFTDLVEALDRHLRVAPSPAGAVSLAAGLRVREREARRFSDLTRREQEVLASLLAGRSAAEIAAAEQVSMATVRSHIRAVLAKLGVSSQPAAVALTLRSCREPLLVQRMREIHQF
jgi:DNA-binding CsgD family transcriptional regulator